MKKLMLALVIVFAVTLSSYAKTQSNYTFHTTCGTVVVVTVEEGVHWTNAQIIAAAQGIDHVVCGTTNVPVIIV
jgi:2-keto-3-deoxy-L-rhamnonate aldolase RhmA